MGGVYKEGRKAGIGSRLIIRLVQAFHWLGVESKRTQRGFPQKMPLQQNLRVREPPVEERFEETSTRRTGGYRRGSYDRAGAVRNSVTSDRWLRNPGRQEEQETVVITSILEEISIASARAQRQASGTLEPIESLILILFLRSCLPYKRSMVNIRSFRISLPLFWFRRHPGA